MLVEEAQRRRITVVGPKLRDPRLHVAAVIVTLHVLGQTVFHFTVSIAQILAAILTAAVLEVAITLWRARAIVWPASAMLTGNGVAFILRVPGTRHGDWWSTRGLWIFIATAALSLLSKYALRVRGRHLFNPSNLGLVVCFLALGATRADPLDFWWGPADAWLALALTVIVIGGVTVARRTHMLDVVVAFYATFVVTLGVLAAAGHCMVARWHVGPVCNGSFWFVIVTSPELLVFLFFMITDPKTTPAGARARVVFGAGTALLATFLMAPQRTEFGTKVALLGALTLACAARPLLDRVLPAGAPFFGGTVTLRRVALGTVGTALIVAPMIAGAGIHARPIEFATVAARARLATRPAVAIDAALLPPVRITSPEKFANALSQRDATRIATDTVADLKITADALRTLDANLAGTAADKAWLAKVQASIDAGRSNGRVDVQFYTFDRLSVAVLKLNATQAQPEIDVVAHGTVRTVTYEHGRSVHETVKPFETIFVVENAGNVALIVDQRG